MLPKCKAWINIPLCRMISMPIICPTFKINILKMEHAFHFGFYEANNMF